MVKNYQTFFERYLAHSDEKEHVIFALQQILNHFPSSRLNILDVGCGTGVISRAMANQGHQIVGIDTKAMWDEILSSNNPQFFKCDLFEFKSNIKFDLAIVAYVLWEIEFDQWETFIRKVMSLLKPGGQMILIDTSNVSDFDNPFFTMDIFGTSHQGEDYPDVYLLLEKMKLRRHHYSFETHVYASSADEMMKALEFFFANAGRSEFYKRNYAVLKKHLPESQKGSMALALEHSLWRVPKNPKFCHLWHKIYGR